MVDGASLPLEFLEIELFLSKEEAPNCGMLRLDAPACQPCTRNCPFFLGVPGWTPTVTSPFSLRCASLFLTPSPSGGPSPHSTRPTSTSDLPCLPAWDSPDSKLWGCHSLGMRAFNWGDGCSSEGREIHRCFFASGLGSATYKYCT